MPACTGAYTPESAYVSQGPLRRGQAAPVALLVLRADRSATDMGRLSAASARMLQGLLPARLFGSQVYLDDTLSLLLGTWEEMLSLLLLTACASGLGVACTKASGATSSHGSGSLSSRCPKTSSCCWRCRVVEDDQGDFKRSEEHDERGHSRQVASSGQAQLDYVRGCLGGGQGCHGRSGRAPGGHQGQGGFGQHATLHGRVTAGCLLDDSFLGRASTRPLALGRRRDLL